MAPTLKDTLLWDKFEFPIKFLMENSTLPHNNLRNSLTLNATDPVTIRANTSNAADHKHNINRVSQFARNLSSSELLKDWRLSHLPAAILSVPAYFALSSPVKNLGVGGNDPLPATL